jgi:hypothetical protein
VARINDFVSLDKIGFDVHVAFLLGFTSISVSQLDIRHGFVAFERSCMTKSSETRNVD